MSIELDLSNVLEVIAIVVSWMCRKIELNSKKAEDNAIEDEAAKPNKNKFCKTISNILTIFSAVFLVLDCLTLGDYCVMAVLRFSQKYWIGICFYILLFALIPPAVASWERKTKNVQIKQSYVKWNGIYNFFGALSACVMFWIAHDIVGDFSYLKEFQIEGIVSILIPACVGLVFAYQNIEQYKKLPDPDHDADTKWLNQKLNMLHLFNAYFFSTISVVIIICYSIYCYIHNLQLMIHPNYFLFLTLALLFFYSLSQHFHKHVYMVFVVMVPVILISSVYWMSWFFMSNRMRCVQCIFIVIHSLLYACLIFYRHKMIFIGKLEEMKGNRYGKPHKLMGNRVYAIEHGGFQVILLLMIIICYSVSWLVPMLTQRIEGAAAENFITAICEDTGVNADEKIALAKERSTYDAGDQDYDKGKYLEFVYEELHEQILDLGIINEDSTFLAYEQLQKWYINRHP